MTKEKLNILFDATILVDGELGLAKKTGFFVVALCLLQEFLNHKDVHVTLMAKATKKAALNNVIQKHFKQKIDLLYKPSYLSRWFLSISKKNWELRNFFYKNTFARKIFSGINLIMDFLCDFTQNIHILFISNKQNIVYFSPQTNAPWGIVLKKGLKKITILHDCIPLRLNAYKNQINSKWPQYFSNPDYFFFANSYYTLKDFLFFYNVNESHAYVAYLAANKKFSPVTDQELLKSVKKKYHLPKEKKYVFSLGTLEPRKNLIRTVTTFILFLEKNHLTNLILVLGGCVWESFENQLKKNEKISKCYRKYIFHAGYVEDNDLPILYSNAEWFVYTSQYEGFGLPPLEAMQCGCPVITSNCSSLPEVVGDAAIMIDWDSDEQHIEAYEQYYFNENLRKENSLKGLKRAKLFSWEKTASKMIDVIKKYIK